MCKAFIVLSPLTTSLSLSLRLLRPHFVSPLTLSLTLLFRTVHTPPTFVHAGHGCACSCPQPGAPPLSGTRATTRLITSHEHTPASLSLILLHMLALLSTIRLHSRITSLRRERNERSPTSSPSKKNRPFALGVNTVKPSIPTRVSMQMASRMEGGCVQPSTHT